MSESDKETVPVSIGKKGITIRSTIDLLIAQTAIENNLYLLHDDKDFSLIAQVDERLKEY
ncbi:hypothetical protein SAMN04244560_00243 [Thermoanaerobacter thermohydrosulfuricus]|uniref:PIN domain-containing protein n=1 Tax=Thermoanaerobacter thermohydrosulfuricus TaxID=1516 RepID=A0A1G7IE52_THETY|nr:MULTISPECIES: hypothetical protein [Thermoanaerobacter]UZQ82784.1 twitching motility protein PilT [Thermoanaerobacter sp. RKWS2]SDF10982.1 hypothetical protein SAMN04244560_00243 [Thermoanaerobacter thermohydrosulfuricus]SFE14911.1 hypothetical protein SAMN04324257_00707 [Thermoanaerobacter thermohydrosulfuricus]